MLQTEADMTHYPVTTAGDTPRQTVLMWGSGTTTTRSPPQGVQHNGIKYSTSNGDPLKSLAEMNTMEAATTGSAKWVKSEVKTSTYHTPNHVNHASYATAPSEGGEVWPVHQQYQYYPYTSPYHHAPQ